MLAVTVIAIGQHLFANDFVHVRCYFEGWRNRNFTRRAMDSLRRVTLIPLDLLVVVAINLIVGVAAYYAFALWRVVQG